MQDGHESHESDEFAGIATAANVHQFFIPPYSSGLLQLLDTGLFSILSAKYSKELQQVVRDSKATISRTRFAQIYIVASLEAFTTRIIRGG